MTANFTQNSNEVGPYQLGECLGKGSYGAVFEATHQQTGQRVAIKLLHASQGLEAEVQNRFVREVAVLQKLDHENIVGLFDAGLHDGNIYAAMELVECGTLKDVLLARGNLPWREAAEVTLQVSRALAHAHERGCVHRDLKPANLFLSEDGNVKLGDLGLARDLNDSRLTISGQTVGTWRYMPPEQITAEDVIDGRLDIYALGCIVFEMITGRVPFDGPDFATIFDQHLEVPPERLDHVVPDCPSELADLVNEMLAKQPEDRPATGHVVAERIEKLLSRETFQDDLGPRADSNESALSPGIHPPEQLNLTKRLQSQPPSIQQSANRKVILFLVALAALLGVILLAN